MASYPQNFMYFQDDAGQISEFINGARCLMNIDAKKDNRFQKKMLNAGCDALLYEPCTVTSTPPATITSTAWQNANFAASAAPWYFPGALLASSQALGILITDWSGLDEGNITRSVTEMASGRGGAYFGRARSSHRVMKVNVLLHGTTEVGLNYLFRWMEGQLQGCSGASGGGSMLFREYCPSAVGAIDNTYLYGGLGLAKGVYLLQGLTWEDPPGPALGCVVRAASFTLGIADPCFYFANTAAAGSFASLNSSYQTAANSQLPAGDLATEAKPSAWATVTPAVTWQIANTAPYGRTAPIITISSNYENPGGIRSVLPDMRIVSNVYPSTAVAGNESLGRRRSRMVLSGIPSGAIVEINMHSMRLRERGGNDSPIYYDATAYLRRPDSTPRWAYADPCEIVSVFVEPLNVDQYTGSPTFSSQWTVSYSDVTRFGCA